MRKRERLFALSVALNGLFLLLTGVFIELFME